MSAKPSIPVLVRRGRGWGRKERKILREAGFDFDYFPRIFPRRLFFLYLEPEDIEEFAELLGHLDFELKLKECLIS